MAIEWESYYREHWHFVLALTIQATTIVVVTYLMLKTIYFFWCHHKCRKNKLMGTQQIHKMFTITTMFYMACFWFFVASSLFFHVYAIFFDGHLWCSVTESMVVFFMLSRITLQFIYMLRYDLNCQRKHRILQTIYSEFFLVGLYQSITY